MRYLEYRPGTEHALLHLGVAVEDASTERRQVVQHQVGRLRLAGARLARDDDALVAATASQSRVRRVRHGEDVRRQVGRTTTAAAAALVHRNVLGIVDRVVAERVDGDQDGADVRVDAAGVEPASKTVEQ